MLSFSSLLVALTAAGGVLAAPAAEALDRQILGARSTPSGTGTNGGFYYSFYNDGSESSVTYTNGADGSYTTSWTNDNDFVAGKGWMPGSDHNITYSGTFSPSGNAYLSVYGWTTSPLVEYYITESYGDWNPGSDLTKKGSVDSDDGTYDIYETTRTDAPSIDGTQTFQQYWSIRTTKRVGGTVTTANHFEAWKNLGMEIGTFNYQILATEGYESSGSSSITVSA